MGDRDGGLVTDPTREQVAQEIHDTVPGLCIHAGGVKACESWTDTVVMPLIRAGQAAVLRDLAELPAAVNVNTHGHDTGRDWLRDRAASIARAAAEGA